MSTKAETKPAPKVNTTIGDCLNVFHIVNTLTFLGLVLAQHSGMIDIFSPAFVRDGFCVSNRDKSIYVQSHAMCFYGDTAYAILLWIFTKCCSAGMAEASYKPVTANILGVFGHGCGHLYLALKGKVDTTTPFERGGDDPAKHAKVFGILFFFWYSLTMGVKDQMGAAQHLAMALAYLSFHYFCVPGTVSFSYVQAVLILTAAVAALV